MMAGMITLILTGLLRGVRTPRSLVLENLALRQQLVILQRTAPRPRCGSEAVGRRLRRPIRHRDPMATVRLHAILDLEESPRSARPPGHRPEVRVGLPDTVSLTNPR